MKTYKIGVIGGDGIGPEVVREGLKVLSAVAAVEKFKYELIDYPWGSERYLKTGEACPPNVLDEYRKLDAVLLGAIGDPRCPTGLVEHAVIMTMRPWFRLPRRRSRPRRRGRCASRSSSPTPAWPRAAPPRS